MHVKVVDVGAAFTVLFFLIIMTRQECTQSKWHLHPSQHNHREHYETLKAQQLLPIAHAIRGSRRRTCRETRPASQAPMTTALPAPQCHHQTITAVTWRESALGLQYVSSVTSQSAEVGCVTATHHQHSTTRGSPLIGSSFL